MLTDLFYQQISNVFEIAESLKVAVQYVGEKVGCGEDACWFAIAMIAM